jgi:hypothetical protein
MLVPKPGIRPDPSATDPIIRGLAILVLALFAHGACRRDGGGDPLPPGDYTPRASDDKLRISDADRERIRGDALRRAKVWRAPAVPISAADLSGNPPGPDMFETADDVVCKFELKSSDGRTPKFQCVLPGGDVIKVKYGRNNPETFGEVAATRLVAALGFGADRVYVVRSVRCFGCPAYPYPKVGIFDALRADPSRAIDFEMAVIERRLPGREIDGGWGWPELSAIDPAAGGSSRAEVDGLRLLAMFLNNWDAKPVNQRLLCAPDADPAAAGCDDPLVYMQDLGQTFGPKSIDLDGWTRTPVWADAAACRVSMRSLPWDGATFEDTVISEEGRLFLAGLLRQLTAPQVRGLFTGARFTDFFRNDDSANVDAWTGTFLSRVAQIADRPPCP